MNKAMKRTGALFGIVLFAMIPHGFGEGTPVIGVMPPESDLGTFLAHREMLAHFEIRNDGDAPLDVHRVRTSCGCTAVTSFPKHLLPGTRGTLELRFNPYSLSGRFSHSIFIESSDPRQRAVRVQVKGHGEYAVEVRPNRVQAVGALHVGQTWRQEFTLKPRAGIVLGPPVVESNYPVDVELEPVQADHGTQRLTIGFSPVHAWGDWQCTVGIHAENLYNERMMDIVVSAEVKANLSVEPAVFTLPATAAAPVRIPFVIRISGPPAATFDPRELSYGATHGGIGVEFGTMQDTTIPAVAEFAPAVLPALIEQVEPSLIIRAGNLQPVRIELKPSAAP